MNFLLKEQYSLHLYLLLEILKISVSESIRFCYNNYLLLRIQHFIQEKTTNTVFQKFLHLRYTQQTTP